MYFFRFRKYLIWTMNRIGKSLGDIKIAKRCSFRDRHVSPILACIFNRDDTWRAHFRHEIFIQNIFSPRVNAPLSVVRMCVRWAASESITLPTHSSHRFSLFKYLTNEICPRPLEYSKLGIYSPPFSGRECSAHSLSSFFFHADRNEIVFENSFICIPHSKRIFGLSSLFLLLHIGRSIDSYFFSSIYMLIHTQPEFFVNIIHSSKILFTTRSIFDKYFRNSHDWFDRDLINDYLHRSYLRR